MQNYESILQGFPHWKVFGDSNLKIQNKNIMVRV
jgi:hypothetical protein